MRVLVFTLVQNGELFQLFDIATINLHFFAHANAYDWCHVNVAEMTAARATEVQLLEADSKTADAERHRKECAHGNADLPKLL